MVDEDPAAAEGVAPHPTPPPPVRRPPLRERRRGRLAFSLALVVLLNGVSATLLFQRYTSPRATLAVAAIAVAMALVAGAVLSWQGRRLPGAILLLGGMVLLSRQAFNFSVGTFLGSPESAAHVFGLARGLALGEGLAGGWAGSPHPAAHLVLAEASLLTGMALWPLGSLLATLLAGVTAAFAMLAARSLLRGSELAVAAAFLAFPQAVGMGQSFVPLSLAAALVSCLVYLRVRRAPLAWEAPLFAAVAAAVALTDPAAALVAGAAFLLAAGGDLLVHGREARPIPPMAGVAAIALYLAAVAAQAPILPGSWGFVGPQGSTVGSLPTAPLATLTRVLEAAAFLVAGAAALGGWLWALWDRQGRLARLQVVGAAFAAAVLAALLFATPVALRAGALLTVAAAPLGGWLLWRLPRVASHAAVALLVVSGLTAVAATHQAYPWHAGDGVEPWVEDEAAGPAAFAFAVTAGAALDDAFRADFQAASLAAANATGNATGAPNGTAPVLRHARIVSASVVRSGGDLLNATPFSRLNTAARPGADLFVAHAGAGEVGYTLPLTGAPDEVRRRATLAPTPEHAALLGSIDRLAQYGPYAIYRA